MASDAPRLPTTPPAEVDPTILTWSACGRAQHAHRIPVNPMTPSGPVQIGANERVDRARVIPVTRPSIPKRSLPIVPRSALPATSSTATIAPLPPSHPMPPPLAPTDRDGGHVCQVVAYDRIAEDALRVAEHKAEKRKAKGKTKMLKKQFIEINRMSKEDKDDDDDDLTAD